MSRKERQRASFLARAARAGNPPVSMVAVPPDTEVPLAHVVPTLETRRYHVDVGTNRLQMPRGARLLTVLADGTGLHLWALVDPTAEQEERVIVVARGEAVLESSVRYVGSAQSPFGAVFHVFESEGG